MSEKPILFSAPMIRALLSGSKTQTRRVLKLRDRNPSANTPGKHAPIEPYTNGKGSWNFVLAETGHGLGDPFPCPYGVPGDRLWVREAWRAPSEFNAVKPSELRTPADGVLGTPIIYEASRHPDTGFGKLRPSMFMPRWASRIRLELTDVRVERLHDISEADAKAEGISFNQQLMGWNVEEGTHFHCVDPRASYFSLWEAINGPGSVEANPWLWVLEFPRVPTSVSAVASDPVRQDGKKAVPGSSDQATKPEGL